MRIMYKNKINNIKINNDIVKKLNYIFVLHFL
jgi:hypothetical protein